MGVRDRKMGRGIERRGPEILEGGERQKDGEGDRKRGIERQKEEERDINTIREKCIEG